jgi:type II secretory pathway pseudopilin PulG
MRADSNHDPSLRLIQLRESGVKFMDDNPYESPHTAGEPPVRQPSKLTRRLFEWLVVLGIIAILVALFLPAIRSAPNAARRSQCNNNLRNIALALQNYAEVYQALPPAYTVDADGRPLHSWRTLILPYIEQKGCTKRSISPNLGMIRRTWKPTKPRSTLFSALRSLVLRTTPRISPSWTRLAPFGRPSHGNSPNFPDPRVRP